MSTELISEKRAHYLSGGWALLLLGFLTKGFVILQPNIAGVLVFFGRYSGTIRESGFFWFNPLSKQQNISLRVALVHN